MDDYPVGYLEVSAWSLIVPIIRAQEIEELNLIEQLIKELYPTQLVRFSYLPKSTFPTVEYKHRYIKTFTFKEEHTADIKNECILLGVLINEMLFDRI